jgi:hypothetical protein
MNESPSPACLLDLRYWPNLNYLTKLTKERLVFLENCEHFVKSSGRNRAKIVNAHGMQLLSIPILGGRSHKQLYRDTRIDNRTQWQRQHWQSLQTAYGKAAFFEYYEHDLKRLYQQPQEHLWDWNLLCFQWLLRQFKLNHAVQFTTVYEKEVNSPGLVDFRDLPDGVSAALPYYQVFEEKTGFVAGLSALDLLLQVGPGEGLHHLRQISQENHQRFNGGLTASSYFRAL